MTCEVICQACQHAMNSIKAGELGEARRHMWKAKEEGSTCDNPRLNRTVEMVIEALEFKDGGVAAGLILKEILTTMCN